MPIVLKLQTEAMDPDVPVASLLRTAKAIATKLNLDDALVWINRELNGYEDLAAEDLPSYRRLTGEPKAWNPYHGWQPIHCADPEILESISNAPIGQALGAIEEMLRGRDKDKGHFQFPYPPHIKTMLMKAIDMRTDMHNRLSTGAVFNIVDAVRNLVLDWSLELEKAGILGEGMTFSAAEKVEAAPVTQQFFAQNIGHAGNVAGQARVTNIQTARLDLDDARNLVDQIQNAMTLLPNTAQNELKPVVKEIAQELEADQPDESRVRGLMGSVRTICEGAAGNVVAQGIISGLMKLLAV